MDSRLEMIFSSEMQGDTSFTHPKPNLPFFGLSNKYTLHEMRDTWNKGIKHGIEIGLRRASLEGQKIELCNNVTNERHKEFLQKFYELANEYNCAVQYHFGDGMVIIDRTKLN